MTIEVIAYDKIDEVKWKRFIKRHAEDDDVIDLFQHPRIVLAHAATVEETITGVLFAWTSAYHPFCTYFRMVINPATDHDVIGNELITSALEHPNIEFPLQTSIWETSTALKGFYEAIGFTEVRKTMLPALNVADLHVQQRKIPADRIQTVEEIIDNEVMIHDLIRLVKEHYEQTHLDNPIIDLPLTEWKKLVLSEDLMTNASFVYVNRDEDIIAYSFLHASERADTVELGWCGSRQLDQIKHIPELVKLQIEYAIEREIQYVEGEFDTTSPFAIKVYEEIPFPSSTNWIAYQFSPKD